MVLTITLCERMYLIDRAQLIAYSGLAILAGMCGSLAFFGGHVSRRLRFFGDDQARHAGLAEHRRQDFAGCRADHAAVFPVGILAGLGAIIRLTFGGAAHLADRLGPAQRSIKVVDFSAQFDLWH